MANDFVPTSVPDISRISCADTHRINPKPKSGRVTASSKYACWTKPLTRRMIILPINLSTPLNFPFHIKLYLLIYHKSATYLEVQFNEPFRTNKI